ncbi:MAG: prephenate dehydrogenase [Candidatus Omnitrophota bacterium]
MKYKKIVIIGTGLIGGSIGKALLEKGLAEEVIGVCRRQSSLDRALKEKAVSSGFVNSYEEALPGAEIIFIATPVHTIKEVFEKMAGAVTAGTIVTDVGSSKKEIVEFARRFKDKFSFVGGHPLAGSEKTGVESSNADLFEDSVCILTPTAETRGEDVKKLKELWESIGATVGIISPEKHDENLAFSSHLPHAVAYALAGARDKEIPKEMFATGFKDTTRIASSDAMLWSDIFVSNRDNVLKAIERFKKALSEIESAIKGNKEEDLKKLLENYKALRDELFEKG